MPLAPTFARRGTLLLLGALFSCATPTEPFIHDFCLPPRSESRVLFVFSRSRLSDGVSNWTEGDGKTGWKIAYDAASQALRGSLRLCAFDDITLPELVLRRRDIVVGGTRLSANALDLDRAETLSWVGKTRRTCPRNGATSTLKHLSLKRTFVQPYPATSLSLSLCSTLSSR